MQLLKRKFLNFLKFYIMDPSNLLSSIGNYLYLPQRIIFSMFGFLAIVNAFVMRHSVDLFLTKRSRRVVIKSSPLKSLPDKPKILIVLKDRLNFSKRGDCNLYQRKWKWQKHRCAEEYGTPETPSDMWTGEMSTAIMMSFYLGYIITHIPGGLLAERYGGKWVLALTLGLTALLTIMTPTIVQYYGASGLIVIRILLGLSEGPLFPALSCMMSQWIPPQERGTLATVILSAGHIGLLIVNLLSGIVKPYIECSVVFYFFGTCTLLWFICFIAFCFNDPESNPYIKESEKLYLQQSRSSSNSLISLDTTRPWRQILSSPPMWALIIATIQHDWSQYLMISEIRNIMADLKVFNFWDNCRRCVIIVIPFFLNWMVSVVTGILSDALINRNVLTTTEARKLMTLIAAFGPKICADLTSCLLYNETKNLTGVFNCAMGIMGTYYAGIKLTALDMSPNYAGTLMAIANGLGSVTNIVAPYVNELTKDMGALLNIRSLVWLICTLLTSGEDQNFDINIMEMDKVN